MTQRNLTESEKTILRNALGRYAEQAAEYYAKREVRAEIQATIDALIGAINADGLKLDAAAESFEARLRAGLTVGDLTEVEAEAVRNFYEDGRNLQLFHDYEDWNDVIEEKVPFEARFVFDGKKTRVFIAGEGAPSAGFEPTAETAEYLKEIELPADTRIKLWD